MRFPDDFPIAARWPPEHPDRLQLYSLTTPNGVKISIMLEETGLPYEAHYVDFARKDQKTQEYISLNPNGRIPAIIDPQGPGGRPLALYESGAILHYLADKTGRLLPEDPARKWEAIQWIYWQVSSVGPMFGQVGYFKVFDGKAVEDTRPLQHYLDEARKLFALLDNRLSDREWIMGDAFSIADISLIGMVRNFLGFYAAGDLVGYADFANVQAWFARCLDRPAVQRGLAIPGRPGG